MFTQLVTPSGGSISATQQNADSLFQYHPLQISAIVETVWRLRYNSLSSPFAAWPPEITNSILQGATFTQGYHWPAGTPIPPPYATLPQDQPGIAHSLINPPTHPTNWDHLIYAYLIEATRIFDIFSKVLEAYMFSERLETPSPASQLFWRNVEYLIYGDAMPSMIWTTTSRLRRCEMSNRLTTYYRMFGLDLPHAQDIILHHSYEKPAASNMDFIATFEALAREVWRGIINAKNTSGSNDTDDVAIATSARRIYDMMITRRLNGNLSREEFRAVALMSFLHLSVLYNSQPVQDLKASASSPEQRLAKIAERVGMTAHIKSKPFFDLSQPFSLLMQSIETGHYNKPANAKLLYQPGLTTSRHAEEAIDQYCLATGHDLKALAVTTTSRPVTSRLPPLAGTRMG